MKSKTSGEEVSDTTYLAELVMLRKYHRERKNLPAYFWNLPEYKEEFQKQKVQAVRLRKIFSLQAILNVLNDNKWVFSLYVKKLSTMFKVEERKIGRLESISSKSGEPSLPKKRQIKHKDKKMSEENNNLFNNLDD